MRPHDRVRLGMVGGGQGAFIGAVHRIAARLDDAYSLVCGALSSDAERARTSGIELGLDPARSYGSYAEMFAAERNRPDGMEVVAIVTPNHLHYPVACAALAAGFHVICDKPLATSTAEADELVRLGAEAGRIFAVTYNYSGYPMVRQARSMVARGDLGALRAPRNWPAASVPTPTQSLAAMRALISEGIFKRRRDGRFALNALGKTLQWDAPMSMARMARMVGNTHYREHWSLLADAVRTGEAVPLKLRGMTGWEFAEQRPEFAAIFNDAMTSVSEFAVGPVVAAYDFSPYRTIVDVGGGHGRLLAAIVAATPGARGVLYDLPQVVDGAPELLACVADRVRVEGGSFLESVPATATPMCSERHSRLARCRRGDDPAQRPHGGARRQHAVACRVRDSQPRS